jgi:ribosomal protein S18 acetylase RimI-like enzyme
MSCTRFVRRASVEDLDVLLPLYRSYQDHYGQLTQASESQTRQFLLELLRDARSGFVLLAFEEGNLAGFAAVYFTVSGLIAQRLAHLGDLYVQPPFRKRGIAQTLFDNVVVESRANGVSSVRWLSLESNRELNEWYARLAPPSGTFKLFLKPTGFVGAG